jgi:hypothetical protein
VTKFDSLTAGLSSASSSSGLSLSDLSNNTPPAARVSSRLSSLARLPPIIESPLRMDLGGLRAEPSLLEEKWDGAGMGLVGLDDESFDAERGAIIASSPKRLGKGVDALSPSRGVREGKENLPA